MKVAEIIIELKKQPIEKWAAFWCELNVGGSPDELLSIDKGFFTQRDIMRYISNTIGKKACLKEWNKDRMTNEEFELFFDTKGCDL